MSICLMCVTGRSGYRTLAHIHWTNHLDYIKARQFCFVRQRYNYHIPCLSLHVSGQKPKQRHVIHALKVKHPRNCQLGKRFNSPYLENY